MDLEIERWKILRDESSRLEVKTSRWKVFLKKLFW